MNPTGQDYSFRWICQDIPDARVPSSFVCHVKEGQLTSGKRLAVSFILVPFRLFTIAEAKNITLESSKNIY